MYGYLHHVRIHASWLRSGKAGLAAFYVELLPHQFKAKGSGSFYEVQSCVLQGQQRKARFGYSPMGQERMQGVPKLRVSVSGTCLPRSSP